MNDARVSIGLRITVEAVLRNPYGIGIRYFSGHTSRIDSQIEAAVSWGNFGYMSVEGRIM